MLLQTVRNVKMIKISFLCFVYIGITVSRNNTNFELKVKTSFVWEKKIVSAWFLLFPPQKEALHETLAD